MRMSPKTYPFVLYTKEADRIIEITPNGVIDRESSFDEYLTDSKVKELREKMYQ